MSSLIETFPSADDPSSAIVLNNDATRCYVLAQPSDGELAKFIASFEKAYVDRFWNNAVLQRSEYDARLPYGLSCSAGGHSMFSFEALLKELPQFAGKHLSEVADLAGFDRLSAILHKWRPEKISDAIAKLTTSGQARFPVFSVADFLREAKGDFSLFVQGISEIALSKRLDKRFAFGCMIALRREGWILMPREAVEKWGHFVKGLKMTGNNWAPEPTEFLSESQIALSQELEGKLDKKKPVEALNARAKVRYAVLCSSLSSTRQMTWAFAERILFSTSKSGRTGANLPSSSRIRSHWREIVERNGPVAAAHNQRPDFEGCIRLRIPNDDRLQPWIREFVSECEHFRSGNYEPLYQAFGAFGTWLHSLPEVPLPLECDRSHINQADPSANTFVRFLRESEIQSAKHKNIILYKVSHFFDRIAKDEELAGRRFHNPIRLRHDCFIVPRNQKKTVTHRKRLAGWAMDKLKRLIVIRKPDGGFEWAPALKNISVTQLFPAGHIDQVFCPILPAIAYLLLEYPLRSHQVRWLDSGELDRFIYDFASKTFSNNPSYDGSSFNYGVLMSGNDLLAHDGTDTPVTFQVAVNKVLLGARLTSNFTIPYVSPETLWVIQQVLEWQKLYGAAPERVKEAEEPVKRKNRNQSMKDFYPDICPLFRYPLQRGYFPPTSMQVAYFWGELCHLFDVEQGTALDATTGEYVSKPGVPILARRYRHMWIATHDVHSLRVSGVSFLLDSGVPLAVVAAIAGHHTVQMTLHYYRFEERELRLRLSEAYAKLGAEKNLGMLEEKILEFNDYENEPELRK